MALFFIQLRQAIEIGGAVLYKWSNTFYADVGDVNDAASVGVALWTNALRNAAREDVFCYQVYARDVLLGTDVFTTVNVAQGSQRGSLIAPISEPYFRSAVVTVTIPVAQSRPSRKFWRPGLREADVIDGVALDSTLTTALQTAFDGVFNTGNITWRDPDNELLSGPVTLRLGSRRLGDEATADLPVAPPRG